MIHRKKNDLLHKDDTHYAYEKICTLLKAIHYDRKRANKLKIPQGFAAVLFYWWTDFFSNGKFHADLP